MTVEISPAFDTFEARCRDRNCLNPAYAPFRSLTSCIAAGGVVTLNFIRLGWAEEFELLGRISDAIEGSPAVLASTLFQCSLFEEEVLLAVCIAAHRITTNL